MHRIYGVVGSVFQAVDENGRAATVVPAPDAAYVVSRGASRNIKDSPFNGSGKDTALDGGGGSQAVADYAADIILPDVELRFDGAALNQVGTAGKADKTARVVCVGCDVAIHREVLDGGVLDEVERSHALLIHAVSSFRLADVYRQGMSATVECAAEGAVFTRTYPCRHADILCQFHEFAAVVGVTVD